MPIEHYAFGPNFRILTALWLGGLLFPTGYWAGRTGLRVVPALAWGAVGLTLAAVPWMFGLPAIPWSEWLAAVLGLGLGQLVAGGSWGKRIDHGSAA